MLLAKSCVPRENLPILNCTAVEQAAGFPFTFYAAPAGYLLTESLVAVLTRHEYPLTWLRLGPEDRDPATLLLSFINASRSWDRQFGADTLKQMQRYPGGIYGWPALFKSLAQEYSVLFPQSHTVVLENIHHLDANPSALNLLISGFLHLLPESSIRILISHTEPHAMAVSNLTQVFGVRDLRIDQGYSHGLETTSRWNQLTDDLKNRVISLSKGRSEVLLGVLAACDEVGSQCIQRIIEGTKTLDQLLIQLLRNCLSVAGPDKLLALTLTLELGYFRAETFSEVTGNITAPDGPWLQNLTDGWQQIREIWRPALEHVLHNQLSTQRNILRRVVNLLADMGAVEIAIPIYTRLREYKQAARLIEGNLESMMNYGQWATLNDWLNQLPRDVITESSQILYAQGELQSIYDSVENAKHNFRRAGEILIDQGDPGEACRSLLAESTLALREGDEQRALLSAQDAHALSDSALLNQEQAWANWQLGMLASMDGKPGFAKVRFKDACQLTKDPYTRELFQRALTYTQELENAGLQQEYHHREAKLAEQTGQEILNHLLDLFKFPAEALPDLLNLYGWLGVPLVFKLPIQSSANPALPFDPLRKFMGQIRARVKARWPGGSTSHTATALSPLDWLVPIRPSNPEKEGNTIKFPFPTASAVTQHQPRAGTQTPDPKIMIYCLGPLRVLNNAQFITSWPSHKAQLVFKYLLLHHTILVHKETIMEAFWPEADVESARRNLHQAIYNLRLTLKDIDDDLQIIQFEQEGYHINPSIPIWIDYPVFEQHYVTAQQKERAGFVDQAMVEYALAEEMYMDHLFSEDLYEDWVRSQREYLWQIYLSAATWLAEYHFQKKNYSLAISFGQRILQKDPCEETAHQILMRCFHNQGQRQLAIRQYEICRQALREGLDVEPSGTTKQFFSEILSD